MNGYRSTNGTRARPIAFELHQIWRGDDSIGDVDGEIIGRIARAPLRHEEKVPRPVIGRTSLRDGGQGNERETATVTQSKGFVIIISPKRYKHCHGYMGRRTRTLVQTCFNSLRLQRCSHGNLAPDRFASECRFVESVPQHFVSAFADNTLAISM